jgi:hypothetical protein
LLFVSGAGAAGPEKPSDLLIIVNRSASVTGTSLEEVRNIFLRKKSAWRRGDEAVPIHARGGPGRAAFLERVLRMTPAEEREYWKNARIKKGTTSPSEFPNTLKAVFHLRKGVSYVLRSEYREGVARILLVVPAP